MKVKMKTRSLTEKEVRQEIANLEDAKQAASSRGDTLTLGTMERLLVRANAKLTALMEGQNQ